MQWRGVAGKAEFGMMHTSMSGNVSFSSLMDRCAKPSGLKLSSPHSVFRFSGVCIEGTH